MRINRVMAGAVASVLALGAVAPAFADNDHRRDHDRREWREDRREWRQDRRDWERDRREARRDWERDRRDWHRDHDRYYRPAPPRVVYRPAPPPPRYGGYGWRVGSPYRDYYRGPVYVVNDYPRYHLRRPPYGHHWIRDDRGNMLLVAIATGVIAQYVLSGR
ncbi:RcnB family protein [Stenotrophomonas maltophilia]|uniref:RcnB family protein n=1 Tax=Stenotrophomonas maltophilia TaxID=40324 RepID=UPI00115CC5FC|nr:RcnB family protein [Stenotrophomonas maltophilia]HDS1533788.1 RcnB family protein [Stenotrophomonas maltophilia]